MGTEYEPHGWTTSTLNPDGYEDDKTEEIAEETKEETVKKPDMVDHPFYYNRKNAIECIEEMELIYGPEAVMWFCLLNAHKYRYRSGLKNNGYEDLEKSDWYMNKYKELKEKMGKQNKEVNIQPCIQPWTISPTWEIPLTNTPDNATNPEWISRPIITCNKKPPEVHL